MCIKGNRTITYFCLPASFQRGIQSYICIPTFSDYCPRLDLDFLSVFSEEEPDLNSELEISVGGFDKFSMLTEFSPDNRDSGGDCEPADGEAEDGSDPGHDGVRLSRLNLPRQQLVCPHRTSSTQTGTPAIIWWTGQGSYVAPQASPRK